MTITRRIQHSVSGSIIVTLLWFSGVGGAPAALLTYVTGDTGTSDVIFRVTLDPAVSGSAVATPIIADTIRLDGIDFVAGDLSKVVVGGQTPGGGVIAQYNVLTATRLLPDFVPDTNLVAPIPPASGSSKPSTVLSTATHAYYIENQFGFSGGTHRIMRTPFGGPPGTAAVVFDSAAPGTLGLENLEGLEIVGSRLFFFAEDHTDAAFRALYSIGLTGSGLWDGAAPVKRLGGLTKGAGPDGSDELDYDPVTGMLYGTNIISGEVIKYDPVALTGGFLISPGAITAAPAGSGLKRLETAMTDGIRSTGTGYLVLTGLDGVILSIDLAGVAAGLDPADVKILYDDATTRAGFRFDDLTPFSAAPAPGTLALLGICCVALAARGRRKGAPAATRQ